MRSQDRISDADGLRSPTLSSGHRGVGERTTTRRILLFRAAPEIRFTLRQRLGVHVGQQGVNPHNHDAEDLYQEIMTRTVQILRDLSTSQLQIKNFKQY